MEEVFLCQFSLLEDKAYCYIFPVLLLKKKKRKKKTKKEQQVKYLAVRALHTCVPVQLFDALYLCKLT